MVLAASIIAMITKKAATAAATQPGASSTAARPRLVAKSGSGLRDSAPRASTAANGGKPGAAPDANAVWNKNRRTLHQTFGTTMILILPSGPTTRAQAIHR